MILLDEVNIRHSSSENRFSIHKKPQISIYLGRHNTNTFLRIANHDTNG